MSRASKPRPQDGWQASYQDPLRWKFPQSSEDLSISGEPRVDSFENEFCSTKAVVMHVPTHEPRRVSSGEYPFSWHLGERKRNWEIRIQMRFKKIPERLFFGVELSKYVPVSGTARAVQKALVSACRKIVGECYHSAGDDPASTAGEGELPTFVMPLWAFDQFQVSDPGQEPDLTSNLEQVGKRRTDGVREYIRSMNDAIANFSTDKVYTFCFWGISQFLDVIRWEISGSMFPVRIDFNKLCGKPPVYITMYDLSGMNPGDKRHLPSKKRRFLHVATWTGPRPACLSGAEVEEPMPAQTEIDMPEVDLLELTQRLEDIPDLISMEASGTAPTAAQAASFDLLGLDFGAPSQAGYTQDAAAPTAPNSEAQKQAGSSGSVDLLGLL